MVTSQPCHCHLLGAKSAFLLQLPVPQDNGGWWDSVDSAGEHLRRAVLVGVNGGHQRVLTDLGGHWRIEQAVTPPEAPQQHSAHVPCVTSSLEKLGTFECNAKYLQGTRIYWEEVNLPNTFRIRTSRCNA